MEGKVFANTVWKYLVSSSFRKSSISCYGLPQLLACIIPLLTQRERRQLPANCYPRSSSTSGSVQTAAPVGTINYWTLRYWSVWMHPNSHNTNYLSDNRKYRQSSKKRTGNSPSASSSCWYSLWPTYSRRMWTSTVKRCLRKLQEV